MMWAGRGSEELARLLERVEYGDWQFRVHDEWTLAIMLQAPDSLTGRPVTLQHLFTIPPEFPTEAMMRRWLLDRICDVERHEAMEHFLIDGAAPFFPEHDEDPYMVKERDVPVRVERKRALDPYERVGLTFGAVMSDENDARLRPPPSYRDSRLWGRP